MVTRTDTPQPKPDTAVPSAAAERSRMWQDDRFGLAAYAGATALFCLLAIAVVLFS